jgi:hypothetical protein
VDIFLTADQVKRLTGLERPSAQLRYCKREGIPARLNARNEVIIARSFFEAKKATNDSEWTPDFRGIGKRA